MKTKIIDNEMFIGISWSLRFGALKNAEIYPVCSIIDDNEGMFLIGFS